MNTEALDKARDCAVFARDDLIDAAKGASTIECMVLHPLIVDAAALVISIEAVISAARATE